MWQKILNVEINNPLFHNTELPSYRTGTYGAPVLLHLQQMQEYHN
jgi:hypothetical protein